MSGLVLVGLLLAGQVVPPPRSGADRAGPVRDAVRAVLKAEADAIEGLAAKAGTPDEAARLRALVGPGLPPGEERFVPLAEYVPKGAAPALPEAARQVRAESAARLRELARRAASPEVERFGLAAECLRAALDRDPDDRETRRLLGYVATEDGGWATPHAAENRRAGMVLHPVFGWVPGDWPAHLERGELPGIVAPGRAVPWLPAAEADALRADFARRPWQITTEHFELRTNVPLAEAIRFGRRLEDLHDLFFTLFADLIEPGRLPLARRFRDPEAWATAGKKRHPVWYFASQAEYLALFRERFGRDEADSLGYFMPASEAARFRQPPRSYFFRDEGQGGDTLATLLHEASHQILFEEAGPSAYTRNIGHYWVWEGLGAYFEAIAPQQDGSYLLGRLDGSPLSTKRAEKLRKELEGRVNFLGIDELTGMGLARYRNDEVVRSYYGEGMALVVFLMHADRARYRDGFLDYVLDAYRGRFRTGGPGRPLADRLGVPVRELDLAFRAFVRAGGVASAAPAR
jgi:hypothetical protein